MTPCTSLPDAIRTSYSGSQLYQVGLPPELWVQIISYALTPLEPCTLVHLRRVCKDFYSMTHSESFWASMVAHEFPYAMTPLIEDRPANYWQSLYWSHAFGGYRTHPELAFKVSLLTLPHCPDAIHTQLRLESILDRSQAILFALRESQLEDEDKARRQVALLAFSTGVRHALVGLLPDPGSERPCDPQRFKQSHFHSILKRAGFSPRTVHAFRLDGRAALFKALARAAELRRPIDRGFLGQCTKARREHASGDTVVTGYTIMGTCSRDTPVTLLVPRSLDDTDPGAWQRFPVEPCLGGDEKAVPFEYTSFRIRRARGGRENAEEAHQALMALTRHVPLGYLAAQDALGVLDGIAFPQFRAQLIFLEPAVYAPYAAPQCPLSPLEAELDARVRDQVFPGGSTEGRLVAGLSVVAVVHGQAALVRFVSLDGRMDKRTGRVLEENPGSIAVGDAALATFELQTPLLVASFAKASPLGRLKLFLGTQCIAVAVIKG